MKKEYYKTKESVEEYIELAKDVNGSELIDKLMQFLPQNANLLEIGSGPGTDWNILSKTYNVIGSDFSVEFLKHLNTTYPEGEFIELDAITLNTEKKFDGIYSNKVLQHLKDDELVKSVKQQHSILKPEGIICHSFWKGDGSEVFKGMFVNYFNNDTLNAMFAEYFDILTLFSYAEFDKDDSILLIGKKK